MGEIFIRNIFGSESRQPRVEITIVDQHGTTNRMTWDPSTARSIASQLLEVAEASEQDAFLFDWVKTATGVDDHGGFVLLHEFRLWRDRRREFLKTNPPHGDLDDRIIPPEPT